MLGLGLGTVYRATTNAHSNFMQLWKKSHQFEIVVIC